MEQQLEMTGFIIGYDFFGLSSSAEVEVSNWRGQACYSCSLPGKAERLHISCRRQDGILFWVDLDSHAVTPLSQILGQAIENQLTRIDRPLHG